MRVTVQCKVDEVGTLRVQQAVQDALNAVISDGIVGGFDVDATDAKSANSPKISECN